MQFLIQAAADPKFRDLITEFFTLRGTIEFDDLSAREAIGAAIRHLLHTMRDVLSDQYAFSQLGTNAPALQDMPSVEEAIGCLTLAHDMMHGPLLEDAITVLYIFRSKVGGDDADDDQIIERLDTFLTVLNIPGVSIRKLWDDAAELGEQRGILLNAMLQLRSAVNLHLPPSSPPSE